MAKSDCSQASLLELMQFVGGHAPELQVAVDARIEALTPDLLAREQAMKDAQSRLERQHADLDARIRALAETERLLTSFLVAVRASTLRAVTRPPQVDADDSREARVRREHARSEEPEVFERLRLLVLQDADLIRRPLVDVRPKHSWQTLGLVTQLVLKELAVRPLPNLRGPDRLSYSSSREWLNAIGRQNTATEVSMAIDTRLRALYPDAPAYWSYSPNQCLAAVRSLVEDLKRTPTLRELGWTGTEDDAESETNKQRVRQDARPKPLFTRRNNAPAPVAVQESAAAAGYLVLPPPGPVTIRASKQTPGPDGVSGHVTLPVTAGLGRDEHIGLALTVQVRLDGTGEFQEPGELHQFSRTQDTRQLPAGVLFMYYLPGHYGRAKRPWIWTSQLVDGRRTGQDGTETTETGLTLQWRMRWPHDTHWLNDNILPADLDLQIAALVGRSWTRMRASSVRAALRSAEAAVQ